MRCGCFFDLLASYIWGIAVLHPGDMLMTLSQANIISFSDSEVL